ncbi:uncharacterized protein LOC126834371 [Adelges cooleyi]|uniref:uncharacterized protein LOC126834371 n=1 Tax=Adelges cooleyi TaxID=133065 RepID=UPI00218075FA|nr:uncharacterized protein LOC126834371 [Adelges cooleyi]
MHFKSAVIVCAVYFFTSAWSSGLSRNQIEELIELYNNHENQNNIPKITNLMTNFFGIKNHEEVFTYNKNEAKYANFKNLLIALAYKDKTSDNFMDSMLTPFEAEFYLKEFILHSEYYKFQPQEGYLTRQQISVVFEHLFFKDGDIATADNLINKFKGKNGDDFEIDVDKLSDILSKVKLINELKAKNGDDFKIDVDELSDILLKVNPHVCESSNGTKSDIIKIIGEDKKLTYKDLLVVFERLGVDKNDKSWVEVLCGYVVTAPEFLLIIIDILPEGNGLSEAQIGQLNELYTRRQTASGSIDKEYIQPVFEAFEMATKEHNPLLKFKTDRPAAKELMDLMLVMAERSKTDHGDDEVVLRTDDVRILLFQFTQFDKDGNGILSETESTTFVNEFRKNNPGVENIYSFDDKEINIAEFFYFHIHCKHQGNNINYNI